MNENEEILVTGRGVLFLTMITYKEEQTKPSGLAIDEVCKILALNRYGKAAMAIRRDIENMPFDNVKGWIESVWDKYINSNNMMDIFESIRK